MISCLEMFLCQNGGGAMFLKISGLDSDLYVTKTYKYPPSGAETPCACMPWPSWSLKVGFV